MNYQFQWFQFDELVHFEFEIVNDKNKAYRYVTYEDAVIVEKYKK